MTCLLLKDDRNGEHENERWYIILAPQDATDILVQVRDTLNKDSDGSPSCLFSFGIGELMKEAINWATCMDGTLEMSEDIECVVRRWAAQLDVFAALLRASLLSKIHRPADEGDD